MTTIKASIGLTKVCFEKIRSQYADERNELLKEYESRSISKDLYDRYLEQLNSSENMDIIDATFEGVE
jgi:hypothetical protein|tara:strand:- start:162 stop:365 length:204 start_codon:yes stop_codon:yes gene_type:complete